MQRLRWFDREPEDQGTPIPWTHAAIVTATLFLNFPFWVDRGYVLWIPSSFFLNAAFAASAVALVTALGFAGPALLCHGTKRSFFDVLKTSFGSLPALAIRFCCAVFLTGWIADLVSFPASRSITHILRREVSNAESTAIAAALVIYLFATSLQSDRTNARLALFMDKFGIAILLAALIRVRHGLPGAFVEYPNNTVYSVAANAWSSLSELVFVAGPLILLAAVFGYRLKTRREIALTGAIGLAVPLFGTLLLIYVICHSIPTSGYRAQGSPSVGMALWSRAARSAVAPRMLLTMVTIFGAVRFGARVLMEALGSRILLTAFGAVVVWYSVRPDDAVPIMFDVSAKCLLVVAAVLTADFLTGARTNRVRKIDWIGFCALGVGLATALVWRSVSDDSNVDWWHPWVLPSYAVAFLICLAGRLFVRLRTRGASLGQPVQQESGQEQ